MYFWLKFGHIAAVAIWFTGLFLLPRLFIAGQAGAAATGKMLYFAVMTPAAAVAVALGLVLIIAFGFDGAWLPAKLSVVALAVLLHIYLGVSLDAADRGAQPRRPVLHRVLNWLPVLLFLAIVALTAGKPGTLPPLGGV